MGLYVHSESYSAVSIDEGAHTCVIWLQASYSGNDGSTVRNRQFSLGAWGYNTPHTEESWTWNTPLVANITVAADDNLSSQASCRQVGVGYFYGSGISFKTNSVTATASTPSSSNVAFDSADITCNYYPNTNDSTCSAQLQYKRTVDSSWTNAGTPGSTSGYAQQTESETITGLSGSTSYDVRLSLTRTTADKTTATSATHTFVTPAGAPTVTTDAASAVTSSTAQLNDTVTINGGTTVTTYWKWGTDNPPTQNTTASQSVSGDGSFSVGISGLTSSTTYYAKAYTAFATPSGSPASGSVVQFTTAADPAVEAAAEDHMHIYEYDGKYGVAKTVYFTLQSPSATSSDRLVTTAPGTLFAAGDIKVSVDGGGFVNAVNSVSQIAASNPLYSLALDATTEMVGENIVVQIVDQNGPAFRDALIHVRTKLKLGQIEVDASQLTNTSAVTLTGIGSGHGLSCVGGATGMDINGILGEMVLRTGTAQAGGASTITLDASASATNDYYNGSIVMIIESTGAGQARIITDYVGGTQVATVNKSWATNPAGTSRFVIVPGPDTWAITPGAELAALPTYASNYADFLQFIFQRFVYKRTQTATVFTMMKDDGSTTLASGGVSDNGTTQVHNELS